MYSKRDAERMVESQAEQDMNFIEAIGKGKWKKVAAMILNFIVSCLHQLGKAVTRIEINKMAEHVVNFLGSIWSGIWEHSHEILSHIAGGDDYSY